MKFGDTGWPPSGPAYWTQKEVEIPIEIHVCINTLYKGVYRSHYGRSYDPIAWQKYKQDLKVWYTEQELWERTKLKLWNLGLILPFLWDIQPHWNLLYKLGMIQLSSDSEVMFVDYRDHKKPTMPPTIEPPMHDSFVWALTHKHLQKLIFANPGHRIIPIYS